MLPFFCMPPFTPQAALLLLPYIESARKKGGQSKRRRVEHTLCRHYITLSVELVQHSSKNLGHILHTKDQNFNFKYFHGHGVSAGYRLPQFRLFNPNSYYSEHLA